jgi:hypothetical protein
MRLIGLRLGDATYRALKGLQKGWPLSERNRQILSVLRLIDTNDQITPAGRAVLERGSATAVVGRAAGHYSERR